MENNDFVINKNGKKIRKWCASCKYKSPFDKIGKKRFCNRNNEKRIVFRDEVCNFWEISEGEDSIK